MAVWRYYRVRQRESDCVDAQRKDLLACLIDV